MKAREIKPDIYSVGVVDWDRRLFDELIPLPDGTSYNSYLIRGSEKTALIDAVDSTKEDELIANLSTLNIDHLDYLVANHAEQDHSGGIPRILDVYTEAKVITNKKCRDFLIDLLLISEGRFITIEDGDNISLGNKTLEFIIAPWVHWPETMLTYLKEDNILFSCDLFGSHLATSQLYAICDEKLLESAKRYYAEIMMPFRNNIKNHLERLENYNIGMIAPSHGPIYKKPEFIMDAYKEWVSDDVKNEVVLPYVSMHGSTQKMVEYFIDALIDRGIEVKPFNLTVADIGEIAVSLVNSATVVLGTPTVLTGPHPSAVYATYLMNILRPNTRFISIIGSYGWGGRTVELIKGLLPNLKAEILEPVIAKGYPNDEDFRALDRLADNILNKHIEAKIVK
ncbi:MAG: FprA family A-type flavoprotein [Candidatus Coatesbacteria bacterium]|nr:MAG: FprA family A-type flavoprotein [Candidatus Coatesbacteria bacterium]